MQAATGTPGEPSVPPRPSPATQVSSPSLPALLPTSAPPVAPAFVELPLPPVFPTDMAGAAPALLSTDGVPSLLHCSGPALVGWRFGRVPEVLRTFPHPVDLALVDDLDGDGLDEAFCSWATTSEAAFEVVNPRGAALVRCRVDGATHRGRPDRFLHPLGTAELDGLPGAEILAAVDTGYGLSPRGLQTFDGHDGTAEWIWLSAAKVTSLVLLPGREGPPSLIVGTSSPGNGARLTDGSTDMKCYVAALSLSGTTLWRSKVGGHYTSAEPSPLCSAAADGEALAVRVSAMPDFRPECGEILLLDGRGAIVKRHDLGSTCTSFLPRPLPLPSGSPASPPATGVASPWRYAALDRRGTLVLLDGELETLHRETLRNGSHESVMGRLEAFEDLDGDGGPELLALVWEREFVSGRNPRSDGGEANVRREHGMALVVLHEDGRRAELSLGGGWPGPSGTKLHVADFDGDGAKEILVAGRGLRLFRPARRRGTGSVPTPRPE